LGMAVNGVAVLLLVALFVGMEDWIKTLAYVDASRLTLILGILLLIGVVAALLTMKMRTRTQQFADALVAIPAALLLAVLSWRGLQFVHTLDWSWPARWGISLDKETVAAIAAAVP